MLAQPGKERRQHPRRTINIEVHLSCSDGSLPSRSVSVHDISLTGVAICADDLPLKVGDKLCLCLSGEKVACGKEHLIETTVVNLRDALVGLRFDSVGIHVLKDLQQLLRNERSF